MAAFLAVCGGLIAYGSHRKQIEWDAAISVQAVEAAANVIREAENTARVEQAFAKTLAEHDAQVKIVEREVQVYVQGKSKKCPVSPELERAVDAVSGMLDASKDGVPSAAGAAGAITESPEASIADAEDIPIPPAEPLTDDALLLAYENAVVELDTLWGTYAALVEWVRSSYALERTASGH